MGRFRVSRCRTGSTGGQESPIWSPDGTRIAFVGNLSGRGQAIWVTRADDSGPAQELYRPENHAHVGDWSADGKTLAFMVADPQTLGDIWTLPVDAPSQARPWLKTQYSEREPRFSRDGRWIAYASNESGRDEVYVRAFAGAAGKYRVSTAGGDQPVWGKDGDVLFYRNGDQLMRAMVRKGADFQVDSPIELFRREFDSGPVAGQTSFDVASDGVHFLMIGGQSASSSTSLRVVLHWFDELAAAFSVRR